MSNEEPDPRPSTGPEPELGGVFLNSIPVEGGILQKRKRNQGLSVKGFGDFSREDIEDKARISCPEERESIMEGGEGFKGKSRASGSKLGEDQSKEGRMLPFGRADGPVDGIIFQAWGPLVGMIKEHTSGGCKGGGRRGELEANLVGERSTGGLDNVDWWFRRFGSEGPMGTKNRISSRPDGGFKAIGEITLGRAVAEMVKESLWRCLGKTDKAIASSLGRRGGTRPLEESAG